VELVREQLDGVSPRSLGAVPSAGAGVNGQPCGVDCCAPVRRPTRP
jgi:ferrochelatase